MLDLIGKDVKLWVNAHEGKDGRPWYTYSVSISKKVEDKYVNKGVKIIFGRDTEIPRGLKNGDKIDFQGFPTLDIYTDRDGNERREIAIFAKTVRFLDYEDDDSYEEYEGYDTVQEHIPF